ncbi:MAG TPA: ATP-binding protein [Pyrinomonadaceae bacterium]|nr:ATP-binding protein [Pyrinomonadaceae bacterium]
MSLLEAIQLIGYSTGAALHLWMGALLWRRRRGLNRVERVLLALTLGFGLWHTSNLFITLHTVLGLDRERWSDLLRIADTIAVMSITLSYSLLLHLHLYLWAAANSRPLKLNERFRVYFSYIPAIFLVIVVPLVWQGDYAPLFVKVSRYVLPFAVWASYVLAFVAVTDILIARRSASPSERRWMTVVAASLLAIAAMVLAAYGFHLGEGTIYGFYLKTITNLGSLLPSAVIAYYIYRYRYLELIIKESLIIASFAAVVLAIYLYGIRTFAEWVTARYGLRAGAVEALLILGLVLSAAPFRRWLENRFRKLFEQEASLYREVVARIGSLAGRYRDLPELLRFAEERTAETLGLGSVRIIPRSFDSMESESAQGEIEFDGEQHDEGLAIQTESALRLARGSGLSVIEDSMVLSEFGCDLAFPLRRENELFGVMLVKGSQDALTDDVRAVLEVLAGQLAIAIEDCMLVEKNVKLEQRVAQGERLAALGRMAATVAHEVKNPLSAIKSIAQVMSEDEKLVGEYSRDLGLIIGETERLSRSVTQLLSFARHSPPPGTPSKVDDLIQAVVELFRPEARTRNVSLEIAGHVDAELNGASAAAVRDALSNLLINATQATPRGGRVRIEAAKEGEAICISVTDSGPGVPAAARQKIWEPFFTTKQRGTGLGLAIVRKRMEEIGGRARLSNSTNGTGARFELIISC